MTICKDGRIWGQNNKNAGNHLGILSGKRYKYIKKGWPKTNKKLSIIMKKEYKNGRIPWNKGKKCLYVSKRMKGKNNPMYGKSTPHGKRIYYKETCMRSSWETKIAQLADQNGIEWIYEPKRFVLQDKTYCPDFYFPKWNLWVEIKGWFHKRHQETIRQFRKLYPQENLLIINSFLYKKYIEKLELL